MKKVLLASAALVMSAGVAAADVSVGGDGRMGILDPFTGDLEFSSRIRISFTASGTSDSGLTFGGSVRADNADNEDGTGGTSGTGGKVYLEGSFGKLTMGDVDSAAKSAVGHVSGVGYTGIGDLNESTYLNGGDDEGLHYTYSSGDLTFYASHGQLEQDDQIAIGVKYAVGDITVALGYEDNNSAADAHLIAGVTAAFGDATVKAIYGDAGAGDQFGVSLDYTSGATTFTVFMADDSDLGGVEAVGLGVAYDLGGGLAIKGGYADNKTANTDGFDLGVTMSF